MEFFEVHRSTLIRSRCGGPLLVDAEARERFLYRGVGVVFNNGIVSNHHAREREFENLPGARACCGPIPD